MTRFLWKVITPQGLENLRGYGYHGVDNSFFGNLILNRFWNWCVELVPMWVAPNVLTLLGLICNILAYVVIAAYTPHLTEQAPRWSYFVSGILIFTYQVLDNVDGKQARRTKSSSPLGELFDHGCDALSVVLFALIGGGVLQISYLSFWLIIAGCVPFYLAHWEEYHTGSLVLGQFNGPTEAQLVIVVVLFITGIAGPWIWAVKIGTDLTVGWIPFMLTIVGAVYTIITNFAHVIQRPGTNISGALRQLIPIFVFVVLSIIWFIAIPLKGLYFHFSMNILGIIFAYLTSRLIVNRICKEPVKLIHWLLIPFAVESFILLMLYFTDFGSIPDIDVSVAMIWLLFFLSTTVYLYFAVSVVIQLANYLNIRVFKIPYPPPTDTSSSSGGDSVLTVDNDANSDEAETGLLQTHSIE